MNKKSAAINLELDLPHQIKSMRFNRRSWALRNLKRSGFSNDDQKMCYVSLIRPVFDFTAFSYHSLLSAEQSKQLEGLQRRAIRIITRTKGDYAKKWMTYASLLSQKEDYY